MSLFSKKTKEEAKEELRDDYVEFGNMVHISDGSQITITNKVYNVTFDEMLARIGKVTADKENGNAFIVQQFMTLKEHDEMVAKHSRHDRRLDN